MSPEYEFDTTNEKECRIIRQSLKNLHQNTKKKDLSKLNNSVFKFNESASNREEYTQLNLNDKTAASTHMTSEYGMLQNESNLRSKFGYKNQPSQTKTQNPGYSVLNPCYSDTSSMNISALPNNNSAIVICTNDPNAHSPVDRMDCLKTCRNNFKTEKVRFLKYELNYFLGRCIARKT